MKKINRKLPPWWKDMGYKKKPKDYFKFGVYGMRLASFVLIAGVVFVFFARAAYERGNFLSIPLFIIGILLIIFSYFVWERRYFVEYVRVYDKGRKKKQKTFILNLIF